MSTRSRHERTPGRSGSRRGRLPADERAARRDAMLDAALAELLERGPDGLSMLGVAQRAGASKETLYTWFGNRDGLLTALIERNADGAAERVHAALEHDTDPRATLTAFAAGLLRLLTSPASVALNRAAMASPDLAEILLRSGRHRVGPIAEDYLARLHESGVIDAPVASDAFELFYGLAIRDTQIRVLLGEPAPDEAEIAARANDAVDRFLTSMSP